MSDENSMEYLKKLILDQQAQILNLEKRVTAAQIQAEKAENYTRQDCLVFRGQLNIRPNSNLRDEMIRLIDYHTGVQFPSWCINTVHWLKYNKSIIVRFNNKSVKEAIYRNRVPKDDNKRGLFIHESLTDVKMALVVRCSKLRTARRIGTYYTQGGNVYVKKEKGTPGMLVTPNMSDDDILTNLANQPASYRDAARSVSGNSSALNAGQRESEGSPQSSSDQPESRVEGTSRDAHQTLAAPGGDSEGTTQGTDEVLGASRGADTVSEGTGGAVATLGGAEGASEGPDATSGGAGAASGSADASNGQHSTKRTDKKSANSDASKTEDKLTCDKQPAQKRNTSAGARTKESAPSTSGTQNTSRSQEKVRKSKTSQGGKTQGENSSSDDSESDHDDYDSAAEGGEQTVNSPEKEKASSASPKSTDNKSKRGKNRKNRNRK